VTGHVGARRDHEHARVRARSLLRKVHEKRLTRPEAAEVLQLSPRQVEGLYQRTGIARTPGSFLSSGTSPSRPRQASASGQTPRLGLRHREECLLGPVATSTCPAHPGSPGEEPRRWQAQAIAACAAATYRTDFLCFEGLSAPGCLRAACSSSWGRAAAMSSVLRRSPSRVS
jgi:hypothetical protein